MLNFHTQLKTALAGAATARHGLFPASGFCSCAAPACVSISIAMTTAGKRSRDLAVLPNFTIKNDEMVTFRLQLFPAMALLCDYASGYACTK